MISAAISLTLSSSGIYLLFKAWKKTFAIKFYDSSIGWLLIFSSVYFWIKAVGWEYGLVYSFTVPSIIALAFVATNKESRSPRSNNMYRTDMVVPELKKIMYFLKTFCSITLLACIAALLSSAAISYLLPTVLLNRLIFGIFFMPVLWGAYSYWVLTDPSQARPLFSLLGISASSFIFIRYLIV